MYGAFRGTNTTLQGEGYVLDAGNQWIVGLVGGSRTAGSHGGPGGAAGGQTAAPTNDSLTAPVLLGGGGGTTTQLDPGSNGGGRADLIVNGTLTLAGDIRANGANVSSGGNGGGAGGSIRLRVGILAGTGIIEANGGNMAGGGGRIAIESPSACVPRAAFVEATPSSYAGATTRRA